MAIRTPDSGAEVLEDGRRVTPSSQRNLEPILEVLRAEAPAAGRLLEIASGAGLHAAAMAGALPGLEWQPSDADTGCFRSISAWAAQSAGRIRTPIELDVTREGWDAGMGRFEATLSVNLLHLIPQAGAARYIAGLPQVLSVGGVAFLYGPFLRDGQATSPGDAAFDANLRAQDAALGYKDLGWVVAQLEAGGLTVARHEMPANNVMLMARKTHA